MSRFGENSFAFTFQLPLHFSSDHLAMAGTSPITEMGNDSTELLSIKSNASSNHKDAVESNTDPVMTDPTPPAEVPHQYVPPQEISHQESPHQEFPGSEIPSPYTNYFPLVARSAHNSSNNDLNAEDQHKLKTAPLFSSAVHSSVQATARTLLASQTTYPQYGLLGVLTSDETSEQPLQDKLVFSNTEEPHSIFICGSQGSGKSHTLSCLLENSLLRRSDIGCLTTPLSAMVFHYDKFSNFNSGQVCEAAYLCSIGIPVRVLVAPTSLNRMTKQYTNLPGVPLSSPKPKVMPLYFSQEQLSVDIMMTLMAVHDTGTSAPLYICAIAQILREIALKYQDRPGFDYSYFRGRLACLQLVQGQSAPLNMRLDLLEGVLLEAKQTEKARKAYDQIWTFEPGTLTIVDLSDQFVNEQDACALFSICLKLFMDGWKNNPRMIALDEAHKFLNASTEATLLTNDLIAIVRQQRHLSSRVIVATQEPTVSGALLDLCNISIVHRFNSPQWYSTLRTHLAGANVDDKDKDGLFREIVQLSTGEALVFCPTAVLEITTGKPKPLRDDYAKVQVRDRVSADGGRSILPSHQFHNHGDSAIFKISAFRRFDSSSLPAPGSLASKGKVSSSAFYTMPNVLTTSSSPASDSVISHKRAASTDLQPERRQTRSMSHIVLPATSKYPNAVTHAKLESYMDEIVRNAWSGNLPHDPKPHLVSFLKKVSVRCGRTPTYLVSQVLLDQGVQVSSMDMMKRIVKQYYDDRGIPQDRRCGWAWLQV